MLEARDGKTPVTSTSVFDTQEDRDGIWNSGLEVGARETWDRFAEVLQGLRKGGRS